MLAPKGSCERVAMAAVDQGGGEALDLLRLIGGASLYDLHQRALRLFKFRNFSLDQGQLFAQLSGNAGSQSRPVAVPALGRAPHACGQGCVRGRARFLMRWTRRYSAAVVSRDSFFTGAAAPSDRCLA